MDRFAQGYVQLPNRKPQVRWVRGAPSSPVQREPFAGLATSGESPFANSFSWGNHFVSETRAAGQSLYERPASVRAAPRVRVKHKGDFVHVPTDFTWKEAYR